MESEVCSISESNVFRVFDNSYDDIGNVYIVPGFAGTLNMARFYHMTLFFLPPLFVLGFQFLTSFLVKRRTQLAVSLLVSLVIVTYFLFQTGFIYEVVKDQSWSSPIEWVPHGQNTSFLFKIQYRGERYWGSMDT